MFMEIRLLTIVTILDHNYKPLLPIIDHKYEPSIYIINSELLIVPLSMNQSSWLNQLN